MTTAPGEKLKILMVDDDPEDVFLTKHAFRKGRVENDFRSVSNGKQLLEYLRNEGQFADRKAHPRPNIVLLDINMPIMNGFEALEEIRKDPDISDVPVVIMTTSREHVDISRGYSIGASSYIAKPVTPAAMTEVVEVISNYWFKIAELPHRVRP